MAYMSWRPFPDVGVKHYYEDNPEEGYRQYLGDLFGNIESPLLKYARAFFPQARAQYLRASETDPGLMWVDTLGGDLQGQLRSLFYQQPASARGETLWFAPQGRMTSEHY